MSLDRDEPAGMTAAERLQEFVPFGMRNNGSTHAIKPLRQSGPEFHRPIVFRQLPSRYLLKKRLRQVVFPGSGLPVAGLPFPACIARNARRPCLHNNRTPAGT